MNVTILVIDDNKELRENTAEILDLAGYTTVTAENGRRGVELALKEKPALIVCDIMMPELDGYGVLHLLRRNSTTQHIPFIFLTAKTERTDFRKGMELGADDYVTKPFDDIELLNAIEVRLKKAVLPEGSSIVASEPQPGLAQFIKEADGSGGGLPETLSNHYPVEHFSRKQNLYQEGRRPGFLYYLLSGKVKAFKTHEDGKEYITDLFNAGEFMGYTALIEDKGYSDSAVALEESEVVQIPREAFQQLLHSDSATAARFIQIVTRNVKEKEERLVSLAYSSLRKRVVKALVDIHDKFYSQGGSASSIEFSRDDLAQYVGTATESLIRTLSDFKSENLIDSKGGKLSIANLEKLKHLLY